MKIRYTATARAEAAAILTYVARNNPAAAVRIGAAIDAAIVQLRTFPRIGVETDQPDIFMKIVRPYRYLIFYRIGDDAVVIRNIYHPARQKPPSEAS